MKRLLLLAALTLSACGVAGEPERPQTGATITGEVSTGVQGNL